MQTKTGRLFFKRNAKFEQNVIKVIHVNLSRLIKDMNGNYFTTILIIEVN